MYAGHLHVRLLRYGQAATRPRCGCEFQRCWPRETGPFNFGCLLEQTPGAVGCPYSQEIVRELLRRGAKTDVVDNEGTSALGYAVLKFFVADLFRADIPGAEVLLEYKADPNQPGPKQRTPVHVAAATQNLELFKLLLSNGGDPRIKDSDGRTVVALFWNNHPDPVLPAPESPPPLDATAAAMFADEQGTDFALVLIDQTRIHTHKIFLRHRGGGLLEGLPDDATEVNLPTESAPAAKNMLEFIFTGRVSGFFEISIDLVVVSETLNLARRYNLQSLVSAAEYVIMKNSARPEYLYNAITVAPTFIIPENQVIPSHETPGRPPTSPFVQFGLNCIMQNFDTFLDSSIGKSLSNQAIFTFVQRWFQESTTEAKAKPAPTTLNPQDLAICKNMIAWLVRDRAPSPKYACATSRVWWFFDPVEDDIFNEKKQRYGDVVTKKVDISSIRAKLASVDKNYNTPDGFKRDVMTMFNNAEKFNGEKHPVTVAARELKKEFQDMWNQREGSFTQKRDRQRDDVRFAVPQVLRPC